MASNQHVLRRSFMSAIVLVGGWIVAAVVLYGPLQWLHEAVGTFPALQLPINALIVVAVGTRLAMLVWSRLVSRLAPAAKRATPSRPLEEAASGLEKAGNVGRVPWSGGNERAVVMLSD